ncbi:Iron-sulfur clusters transporter atm1 mitochondrial, partial [Dissostichus eleginoides]
PEKERSRGRENTAPGPEGQEGLVSSLNTSPAPWGSMTCISGPLLSASPASTGRGPQNELWLSKCLDLWPCDGCVIIRVA